MPQYNIEAWQEWQAHEQQRKAHVVNAFRLFANGFFSLLEEFVADASERGLTNVSPPDIREQPNCFVHWKLMLAGMRLQIAANYDALPAEQYPSELCARILIYEKSLREPLIAITFNEIENHSFGYEADMFTPCGDMKFIAPRRIYEYEFEQAGEDAAELLLGMLYHRVSYWREKPALETLIGPKSNSRMMGFQR